jgi:hypothetical protein
MKQTYEQETNSTIQLLRGQSGFSILAIVFVMLVLSAIGYSMARMMATKQMSVPVTAQSSRAFYLAQGGLDWAGKYLDGLSPDQWSGLDQGACADYQSLTPSVTKTLGTGNFNLIFCDYNCTTVPSNQEITVISVGEHGNGKRTVATKLHRELWFGCYEPSCS